MLLLNTYRSINLVHGSEIIHISEENSGLDNLFKARTSSLENLSQIEENLLGLFLDLTLNNLAYKLTLTHKTITNSHNHQLTSGRVQSNLTRGVDKTVGLDSLS